MSLHADLASLQSTLDQSLERLAEAVRTVQGTALDDFTVDLFEVERHLRAATRRLGRTLSELE